MEMPACKGLVCVCWQLVTAGDPFWKGYISDNRCYKDQTDSQTK